MGVLGDSTLTFIFCDPNCPDYSIITLYTFLQNAFVKRGFSMDERKKPIPQLMEIEPMQDGYRWVAITAMLLAIGIILHTVSPNVGGVTPNWTIAMYSIVINLTRPRLTQAIGIGFIAGLTLVPSSK